MNGVVETAANNHLTSAERDRGVDLLSRGVWYGVKLCEVGVGILAVRAFRGPFGHD